MKLTAENVNTTLKYCLFNDGESQDNAVLVDGLVTKFSFRPERLKETSEDIYDMLKQLPKQFQRKTGGGWSFLNACNNVQGEQWGEQPTMEALFCLGIAIDKAKFLMPRELWISFPGGVPYVMVG